MDVPKEAVKTTPCPPNRTVESSPKHPAAKETARRAISPRGWSQENLLMGGFRGHFLHFPLNSWTAWYLQEKHVFVVIYLVSSKKKRKGGRTFPAKTNPWANARSSAVLQTVLCNLRDHVHHSIVSVGRRLALGVLATVGPTEPFNRGFCLSWRFLNVTLKSKEPKLESLGC